jgi:CAAX protease family protein
LTVSGRPDRGPLTEPGKLDRSQAVRQYSLAQILAVWAAAAIPMGVLSWVVAPWLSDRLGGDEPLVQALLICIPLGLIWQFALVMILARREVGTLRLRDALWLRSPRDPKTGRAGGRVWLWALPFMAIFGLGFILPGIPGPSPRALAEFLGSDAGEDFFRGAWGWLAVIVVFAAFNTVLGEELLFRGLLLPRMRGVFGRYDWVANGVLFACYHLHTPWVIPTALINIFAISYPSRRFESAWIGILVHSSQSVGLIAIVLALVLD